MTSETRVYPANFGEQAQGIQRVILPLGSVEAIERLAHDVLAFGYGMGESAPQSAEQLSWHEKAEAARAALMENVRALAASPVPTPGAPAGDARLSAITVHCNYASGPECFSAIDHGADGCGPDVVAHGATWLDAIEALRAALSSSGGASAHRTTTGDEP